MTPYKLDAAAWQESWDRQQEAYLPDREHRAAGFSETGLVRRGGADAAVAAIR